MNQRRREISKAYQEILSSRMNQRRQDILRRINRWFWHRYQKLTSTWRPEEGTLENLQEDVASTKSGSISSIELHVQETRGIARIASESVLPAALSPTVIR